jgi:predicted nucleotide-binding protein
MNKEANIIAKVSGLLKSFSLLERGSNNRVLDCQVTHLLDQYYYLVDLIRAELPELFHDLPELKRPSSVGSNGKNEIYEWREISPLISNLNYIIEVRTNLNAVFMKEEKLKSKRVFITHGRSQDWRALQSHIEKVLKIETLELAQEPNLGLTVLQKLDEYSNKCGYAVIVMTGDDSVGDETRARENVLHEIGFFQGRYGLRNVILLHEDGVSIPSNIQGLVYIAFPKGMIHATFGALQNDIQALIN